MLPRSSLPPLLVVQYANPDSYPPTYNAVNLLRSRFRVSVVSRRSERVDRTWPEDVHVERVGAGSPISASQARRMGEFGEFVWAVRRAVRAERPRVVYAYEPHGIVATMLAGFAGGYAPPIVYHRHEVENLDRLPLRSPGDLVVRAALPASRRAAVLVFPNKERAAHYQRFVPGVPEPVIVPNFSLRADFPEPDWDTLLAARFARRQVFYRGSIGAAGGVQEAIRALPHLAADATLRLCGPCEPTFHAELTRLAGELGVRSRVDLAGFVPFETLNRESLAASVGLLLYQAVDVNWTLSAGAANKLFEYAACGLPVLVPDRPSYRALVGAEPWVELVDETDPRAIAAAITRVFADRSRYDALCRAARRAFEERFNYEVVFAPLLDRIVALAGPGGA